MFKGDLMYSFCFSSTLCLAVLCHGLLIIDAGKMVRNYKKKRQDEVHKDDMKKAVLKVVGGTIKLRHAGVAFH